MKKSEIQTWLKENRDPRGIARWKEKNKAAGGLGSYGIGLTKLRKFAKEVGRDRRLARQLWSSRNHEMKILALLVDDPKTLSMEQAERQVEQLDGGYLEHVFSSCDATLAKTPFVVELAEKWMKSKDPVRLRCGYGLLYEISKDKRKSAPDEQYFLERIARIERSYQAQDVPVRMSMAGALMGIGMRTKKLNTAALKVAKKIGSIPHSPTCEPFDVVKHLDGDHARKKFGLKARRT